MTCSPERLAANRANSLRSTGPKTPEGKAISRRNSLKHGLTGEGVALPNEDAAEVERRFANFHAELGPRTELGRALTLRVAMLAVRLERCYRNEAARLTVAVDAAPKAHRDGRLDGITALMDGLADDPETNARRLQDTPEGVALTVEAWGNLKVDLMHPERKIWTASHWERAENLLGRRTTDLPRSRIGALSRALWHDFSALDPHEGSDLNEQGKYEYARERMGEIIDGRIEILTGLLTDGHFDLDAEARARASAGDRALFDTSAESVLARKYEAATERSLFRTLREFREVEAAAAEAAKLAEVEAINRCENEVCGDLGSSLTDPIAEENIDLSPATPGELPALPGRSEGAKRPERAVGRGRSGPG